MGHLRTLAWALVIAAVSYFCVAVGMAEGALRASPRLQAVANDWRGVSYPVLCETDKAAWDADPHKRGKTGVTYKDFTIHLAPAVCRALEGTSGSNDARHVFLHEMYHSMGIWDEGIADCLALGAGYQFGRQYFKLSHVAAIVGVSAAWGYHNTILDPLYRPRWCRQPQLDFFSTPVAPVRVVTRVVKQCYFRKPFTKKLVRFKCPS